MRYLLAVDTSCDESCAAVFDIASWKLKSDVVHSHVGSMKAFGGVVPEMASREHLKALPMVVDEALARADLTLQQIEHFCVTNRPGLMGALLVGVSYVKALAFALSRPFSVLSHVEAHLYSPLLMTTEDKKGPPFPWVALIVSGGHTELFYVKDFGEATWLGGTADDAAGEAFDKVGKILGLEYPAGPLIDKWVREKATAEDRGAFLLPRARTSPFHFSYSGLKTAVNLLVQKQSAMDDSMRLKIAASAQEAILDPLLTELERATKIYPGSTMVVTGGVACNSRLRAKAPAAHFPEPRHCTDNAAMVALLGALYARHKVLPTASWEVSAIATSEF